MIKLVAAKVRYMFSNNLLRFCHHHHRRRRGVFCVESPLKRRRRRRSDDENRVCVMSLVVWSSSSSHLETNVEDDAKERSTLSLACATKTRPTPLPIVLRCLFYHDDDGQNPEKASGRSWETRESRESVLGR